MDAEQLETYAGAFLERHFNMSLDVPVRVSKRMKSKLGVFNVKYRGDTLLEREIVLSYNFIVNNPRETILDVLYHECVHYALYTTGRPYRDSDKYFINTLKRLGISKTRTYQYRGQNYLYECKRCKYQFRRNMKGYEKRYICGKCRGKFIYRGIVEQ